MIFQDPYASLNPRWQVDRIVAEPIRAFRLIDGEKDITARVGELLSLVGLHPADGKKYPHEFSGGQRQRIAIARALASNAEFIVCDEPTSALDVSVQAQILNLMRDLQDRLGLTYLFISHNLAVVRHMASRIGVMYLGRIVEISDGRELFAQPEASLYPHAPRCGAGRGHDRAPAHPGQGRDPEPDQSAHRLHLQPALPLRERSLPGRDSAADRGRRLPRHPRRAPGDRRGGLTGHPLLREVPLDQACNRSAGISGCGRAIEDVSGHRIRRPRFPDRGHGKRCAGAYAR